MIPAFQDLMERISPTDHEIASANAKILQSPPELDLIAALTPTATNLPFTFSPSSQEEIHNGQAHEVEVVMVGRGENGLYNLKLVLRHPGSSSLFIYLCARSRGTGLLVDVNFICHATTLVNGGVV